MSGLSDNAQMWLAGGERCAAAETIFTYTSGVDAMSDWGEDYPRNLQDFRRCRLLLEQCPELRKRLPRVAHLSKVWAEIVSFWDDICLLQDLENPTWQSKAGRAPQAAAMLADIIERTKDR